MRNLSRRVIILVIALFVGGAFLSFAPSTEAQPAKGKKMPLMIAGSVPGNTPYIWTAGVAKLINKYLKDVSVSVQGTVGMGRENVMLCQTGQVQLTVVSASAAYNSLHGLAGEPKADLRVLYAQFPAGMQIAVPKDFPGTSIQDLRGKRVSFGPPGSSSYLNSSLILPAIGLKFGDFKAMHLTTTESVAAIKDRSIIAYCMFTGFPAAAYIDLEAHPVGLKLIPFSKEEIAKVSAKYPYMGEVIIPKNTYSSIATGTPTVGAWDTLCARSDFPEDLAYNIVKVMTEHQEELIKIHPAAKDSTAENTLKGSPIPLHPGAAKYFKERGLMK
ncbi:MAG: TAXI family TRAP transporter solute-binding subunit [Deltaproteobacteria bacterium]|nr:TAXI family TRAP transporter solute-binding subunit [Deltaproteobacteria bacterium]